MLIIKINWISQVVIGAEIRIQKLLLGNGVIILVCDTPGSTSWCELYLMSISYRAAHLFEDIYKNLIKDA